MPFQVYDNSTPQGGYQSWKGGGAFQNPVGIASTHIRPLTNNDPGNSFPAAFGRPRPMKHWRRGVHPVPKDMPQANPSLLYNMYRTARTSTGGASLGGGGGGFGPGAQIMCAPGSVRVRSNDAIVGVDNALDIACIDCDGRPFVTDWYPVTSLTDKPQKVSTSDGFCCNSERKAKQRVLPASTNVKKTYFQTNQMRRYNRCQTFDQRQFNFVTGTTSDPSALPGSAAATLNQYVAQCTRKPCAKVYYKPNNAQFGQQGAVSSSTRIMALSRRTTGVVR